MMSGRFAREALEEGPSLNLERHSSSADVARRAADIVGEVVARKPAAVLLLPAGNTPLALYAELLRRQASGTLDLAQAHFFQLDELIGVGVDDERSFHHFLRTELITPLPRDGRHDHLLDGTAPEPAKEIENHAARLNALGPITRTEGVAALLKAGQIANGLAVCHLLSASHFLVTGSEAYTIRLTSRIT